MVLLLLACADIAFTLGEGARAAAADTGGEADTGGGTADTAGETATDTGVDTAADTAGAEVDPLATVYEMGDVVAVPVARFADWISPGDVNGDGLTDLVASVYNADTWTSEDLAHDFELVLSDGSGGYTVTSVTLGILGDNPLPTVVADFDGDGLGELAVASPTGVSVYRYDGTTLTPHADFPVGMTRVITTGDLDNDGDIDLAALKEDEVVLWANDGAGGLTELGRVPSIAGDAGRADQNRLHLYDIDSDGVLDLYTSGDQNYGVPVQVNLGVGDGTFGADITSFPDAPLMFDTFVGDYDGDGANEVAFTDAVVLHVSIGEWTGTVSSPVTYSGPLYGNTWVLPADVDGDGDDDLVGIDGFFGSVLRQESAGLGWRGTFPLINYELLAGAGNQVFVTGDANADGCADLFTYDYPEGYRLSLSRAVGCAGVRDPDTGGGETATVDTSTGETAADTADTAASFTSGEESRRRHGCSTTEGSPAGALGVLLAAFAARRRRAG